MQQKGLTLTNEALDTIVIGIQVFIQLIGKHNGPIKIFLILNKIWVEFYNGDEIHLSINAEYHLIEYDKYLAKVGQPFYQIKKTVKTFCNL